MDLTVRLPKPHAQQLRFIDSSAKRKVIRAGRRGGKTVGVAIYAIEQFLKGRRVLYATPTQEQINRFWEECKRALYEPIERRVFAKNETEHSIELAGTEQRIRAKTAWDADSLRGDYADILILDEFQLMHEETWDVVGAPMLLDNNGDAVFIYTPPSLRMLARSRAKDPRHAGRLFERAQRDRSGRWAAFTFASHDNPYISAEALAEIAADMSALTYRQEILAEDIDEIPGALWTRATLERLRVLVAPELTRVVTAVDPNATGTGDEAGIVTAGIGLCSCKGAPELHGFVLADDTTSGGPRVWARDSVVAYHRHSADALVAEDNNGGEMVEITISTVPAAPPVKRIHASRNKQTRAEPVALLYEQGRVHHVGSFSALEDELCSWVPGMASPNRLDALVWTLTELLISGAGLSAAMRYYRRAAQSAPQEAA